RQHSMAVVKSKLMALDFVLNLPRLTFLATEKEKTDYFCSREGIPSLLLPRKIYRSKTSGQTTTRYFVENFPIALTGDRNESPPVVSFGYIDAGDQTTAGFTSFLDRYRPLLSRLESIRLLYVSDTDRHFESATRQAERLIASFQSGLPSVTSLLD